LTAVRERFRITKNKGEGSEHCTFTITYRRSVLTSGTKLNVTKGIERLNMQQTWKPTVAGILNIVTGAFSFIGLIVLTIGIITLATSSAFLNVYTPTTAFPIGVGLLIAILSFASVLVAVQAVLPLIGGVFALQRKRWGWALAGSIVAIFATTPLGIASTIFVAISREEFE
jgi:hypothetical protein